MLFSFSPLSQYHYEYSAHLFFESRVAPSYGADPPHPLVLHPHAHWDTIEGLKSRYRVEECGFYTEQFFSPKYPFCGPLS